MLHLPMLLNALTHCPSYLHTYFHLTKTKTQHHKKYVRTPEKLMFLNW